MGGVVVLCSRIGCVLLALCILKELGMTNFNSSSSILALGRCLGVSLLRLNILATGKHLIMAHIKPIFVNDHIASCIELLLVLLHGDQVCLLWSIYSRHCILRLLIGVR